MLLFVTTIAVNVLICTVFYLFVMIKLEKSATDFRVKKLQREMDSMIREFNETAERNITLLESKITVINNILSSTDIKKKIDIKLDDEIMPDYDNLRSINSGRGKGSTRDDSIKSNSKGLILDDDGSTSSTVDFVVDDDIRINYDSGLSLQDKKDETELKNIFSSALDKHTLVIEFYKEGYSIDSLVKASGMPLGELKLILTINGLV